MAHTTSWEILHDQTRSTEKRPARPVQPVACHPLQQETKKYDWHTVRGTRVDAKALERKFENKNPQVHKGLRGDLKRISRTRLGVGERISHDSRTT